ncbi:MAG: hypothetical protein IJV01_05905 [Bacteroidales bacterium]|nr:hypothetical protein [Bacteroidales bacterium]
MVRFASFCLLLTVLVVACSPRVTVHLDRSMPQNWEDKRVGLLDLGQEPPPSAEKLGWLAVDEKASVFAYWEILNASAFEVWESGGNVLSLTKNHKANEFSLRDHHRIEGDILFVSNLDSIGVLRRLYAQPRKRIMPLEKKEWELSMGISGMPLYAAEISPFGVESFRRNPESATGMYENSFEARTSGVIALQGMYRFHERFAAIASLGYSHLKARNISPSTKTTEAWEHSTIVTAFAGLRYYYLSESFWRLYGAVQCGLFLHDGNSGYWKRLEAPNRSLGGQITFLGVQFGRKWFGEVEVFGLGDNYSVILPPFGGRLAVGYRF